MTAVPGVSGKMGNIKYFQCTMGAKDVEFVLLFFIIKLTLYYTVYYKSQALF